MLPGRCHSCNRIDSPEWRRGPNGLRTLCNDCGLHYAKLERKRQIDGKSVRPSPSAKDHPSSVDLLRNGSSMHLIRHQSPPSSVAIVQQYLNETANGQDTPEGLNRVATICAACLSLFKETLRYLEKNRLSWSKEQKTAVISLQRSYGRLKMWSDEHDVTGGGIEEALLGSWGLQRDILKHFTSIGQTLADSKLLSRTCKTTDPKAPLSNTWTWTDVSSRTDRFS